MQNGLCGTVTRGVLSDGVMTHALLPDGTQPLFQRAAVARYTGYLEQQRSDPERETKVGISQHRFSSTDQTSESLAQLEWKRIELESRQLFRTKWRKGAQGALAGESQDRPW